VPAGYGCPPDGPTQRLVNELGRHGQRPAHIHFFVSAPGHRHLTTQINIAGDKYLYDDFAFATREGLIPKIVRHEDAKKVADQHAVARFSAVLFPGQVQMKDRELNTPFSEIEFDFTLTGITTKDAEDVVHRRRVEAA
jgi:catechol 1,2-dioxygenase